MKRNMTRSLLKSYLFYDKDTGVFRWKNCNKGGVSWSIAGSITDRGYVTIKIEGVAYKAHRLAWLYVYGRMPSLEIDHIDGDRSNNAINNLRDVSHLENMQNTKRKRENNIYSQL